MPVVSCQTSERLVATVAKVSFNKCPFLEGSLSCFLTNTTPLLAELKYLFQLIFSLTLEIIYIPRLNICRFKPDAFVDCFLGVFFLSFFFIFGFVVKFCLFVVDFFFIKHGNSKFMFKSYIYNSNHMHHGPYKRGRR